VRRAIREVAWVEAKLFWRDPFTVVFVLLLPLATLYLLNGVFASGTRDPTVWEGFGAVDFYTSSYVGLVTATVGVVSLPAHLTSYRERGVMRRFQASPLPMAALLGAQCVVATLTGTLSAVVTVAAARLAYDAQMPVSWPGVLAAYVVVAVAFAVLGVLLGLLLPSSRAAQGVGILLFFTFMMLGGAGPPREVMPTSLGMVSDVVPLTYAAQLLRAPWLRGGWDTTPTVVMAGIVVGALALIWWRVRSWDAT
jgi:ABC-2 type transport system permease protein